MFVLTGLFVKSGICTDWTVAIESGACSDWTVGTY